MSQTEARLEVSFKLTFQLVIIYHFLISKILEQETEEMMSASSSLHPGSSAAQNAQCQVGHCGMRQKVSETYVSTSRYKQLIFGKCMHKALTHFVDLADENQHNRRTYWYISSNIGKYETEFFQCLQMNFDNSHGKHCQRKLMCHLGDTNCLLQSKAPNIR